jgi:hypothetical protein
MSDQGNPETAYYQHTIERTEQAMLQRNWILCATLCRLLAELELEAATIGGAAAAWNGSTRSVPLLKVPMRHETASARPRGTCVACGGPGQQFTELLDASTPTDLEATVPGRTRWAHLDQLGYEVGRDHPFTLEA